MTEELAHDSLSSVAAVVTLNRVKLATEREAIAQLNEYGIGFDKSHEVWLRDYGQRKFKRDWSEGLIWGSTLGIIAVCLVLCWAEWMQ